MRAQKWKSCVQRLVHALNEDGPGRGLQFCEWFLHKCEEWEDFQDSIVWSDEATFKLNENVEKFRYLGVTVTNTNDIREEIKRRINMGNACYYSIEKILSSHLLSKEIEN